MPERPDTSANWPDRSDTSVPQRFRSFSGASSIAQAAIEQDIQDTRDNAQDRERHTTQDDDHSLLRVTSRQEYQSHSLVGSYRHAGYLGGMNHPPFSAAASLPRHDYITQQEQAEALAEERSLLRDNQLIPPESSQSRTQSILSRVTSRGASDRSPSVQPGMRSKSRTRDVESRLAEEPTANESSPLLRDNRDQPNGDCDEETLNRKWEESVADGKIQTTWRRETKVLARFSQPLVLTWFLQWSLTQVSVFTVGHIGKTELGAVSLGSMTANITGYAIYQGLATSLDTLCAQAYGSGHKSLVGLQMQRMVFFLWAITIPIAIIWASAAQILNAIIPDKEVAQLAGLYLKILIAGAPGYCAFESGKRFVQAQGLFSASMYCLFLCAPLNALLHYLFVWVRPSPLVSGGPNSFAEPPSTNRLYSASSLASSVPPSPSSSPKTSSRSLFSHTSTSSPAANAGAASPAPPSATGCP